MPKFSLSKLIVLIGGLVMLLGGSPALAQSNFSGSDPNNFYCPELSSAELVSGSPEQWANATQYNCTYKVSTGDGTSKLVVRNAVPRPPQLEVIQVWFVRLVYVIWAATGIIFTFLLMWIGFKYLTSFGNEYAMGDVVKDFRKWMIGLALIFLSYPALNTLFNILPINDTECFSQISTPGFQFFFPNACVTTCSDLYDTGTIPYLECIGQL